MEKFLSLQNENDELEKKFDDDNAEIKKLTDGPDSERNFLEQVERETKEERENRVLILV